MSEDHKPFNKIEHARILKAGHYMFMKRLNGTLALSRAMGDLDFKNNKDLPAEE